MKSNTTYVCFRGGIGTDGNGIVKPQHATNTLIEVRARATRIARLISCVIRLPSESIEESAGIAGSHHRQVSYKKVQEKQTSPQIASKNAQRMTQNEMMIKANMYRKKCEEQKERLEGPRSHAESSHWPTARTPKRSGYPTRA